MTLAELMPVSDTDAEICGAFTLLSNSVSRRYSVYFYASATGPSKPTFGYTMPFTWEHGKHCLTVETIAGLLHMITRCDIAVMHLGVRTSMLATLVSRCHGAAAWGSPGPLVRYFRLSFPGVAQSISAVSQSEGCVLT